MFEDADDGTAVGASEPTSAFGEGGGVAMVELALGQHVLIERGTASRLLQRS